LSSPNLVGRRLGGFTVERELGQGGMGVVVLARQLSLDRPAVLKRIHSDLAAQPDLEARFEREAMAAARLHHPNVVSVYDRFQYRGQNYIATEFVDGVDLSVILARETRIPWRIAAGIALEVARGLEAIHAEGTLHRDLKPQNLLIGRRGEVKITDFGLALDSSGTALTQPGTAVGTPPYMPAEQLRGERVDPRADVFAFGCVLYEMLTHRPPFQVPEENAPESLLARVESGRYPRIRSHRRDVPRALARLVRQCLRPKASRRIASAAEARRRLESILDRPTPADAQNALASYLWEQHVFEPRATETVVMIAAAPGGSAKSRLRMVGAAAALAAAILCLGLALRFPDEVTRMTDEIRQDVGPLAARLTPTPSR